MHRLPPRMVLGGIDPVVSVRGLDLPFDVVHLHDTLPVLIRRTLKRARRSNIPVVTTFHNDYEKHGLIGRSLKAARWVLQGRRTLHASDAKIVDAVLPRSPPTTGRSGSDRGHSEWVRTR